MTTQRDIDPALFGVWPKAAVYDGLRPLRDDAALAAEAWHAVLDIKGQNTLSPLDELQDMLNGMTKELRQQLQQFRALREGTAEQLTSDDGLNGGGIDRKQVQADAKASIEAMSVIVRTLEKIDSLQRTIAHDRQTEAEGTIDEDGYQALVKEFDARIEARATVLAAEKVAGSLRQSGKDANAGRDPAATGGGAQTGPPD